jgi:hypothetical protein
MTPVYQFALDEFDDGKRKSDEQVITEYAKEQCAFALQTFLGIVKRDFGCE